LHEAPARNAAKLGYQNMVLEFCKKSFQNLDKAYLLWYTSYYESLLTNQLNTKREIVRNHH
jgi:hypothetical protein